MYIGQVCQAPFFIIGNLCVLFHFFLLIGLYYSFLSSYSANRANRANRFSLLL